MKLLKSSCIPKEAQGHAAMAVGDGDSAGVLSMVNNLPAGITKT